jgi:hypothetical protein
MEGTPHKARKPKAIAHHVGGGMDAPVPESIELKEISTKRKPRNRFAIEPKIAKITKIRSTFDLDAGAEFIVPQS